MSASPARAVLVATVGAIVLSAGCSSRKKVLHWGWDEPDTRLLRQNLREMEKSPFDGCVFGVRYGKEGAGGSFTWQF